MNEIWKPIAGYPDYEVSNLGRVKRLHKKAPPRILKPHLNWDGYLRVALYRNGKQKKFFLHRLVALAFIPNPDNKPEINHLNGIKNDDCVENLVWATSSENKQHAFATGLKIALSDEDNSNASLTNEQARYIRENPDNLTVRQLAEMFGVTKSTINLIQLGKTYKNAGGKIRKVRPKPPRVPDEIREKIRREYKPGVRGYGCVALAKKYGVSPQTILNIVREKADVN